MSSNLKLKARLEELVPKWRAEVKSLSKDFGNVVLGETTIGAAIGGMRGIKSLVCDTSYLDPMEGIKFRSYTIPEVREKLPKDSIDEEAYPMGLWYLLLTGEIPAKDDVLEMEDEIKKRQQVPQYVFDTINALPKDVHPMTQISLGVLAMQKESTFAKQYAVGMKKDEYWKYTFEDSLTLLARMPVIAAYIYRRVYKDGKMIQPDLKLDWGANFAHMMGQDNKEYQNLMRLYLILHSDHESGNVSAHTSHLVGSTLSDAYYSVSAGLNGLAGPLHGLANQECLRWILDLMEKYQGVPSEEQVAKYAQETLDNGKVIPGYGHAVLRATDPRFSAQLEFGKKHFAEDPILKTIEVVFKVVPPILEKTGKVKNPWPNVDADSGALQYHYGVKEFDFYTVLFGVSRALGMTSQLVWARAVGLPIERPKSLTTKMLKDATVKKD